jgi:hypothetical protein
MREKPALAKQLRIIQPRILAPPSFYAVAVEDGGVVGDYLLFWTMFDSVERPMPYFAAIRKLMPYFACPASTSLMIFTFVCKFNDVRSFFTLVLLSILLTVNSKNFVKFSTISYIDCPLHRETSQCFRYDFFRGVQINLYIEFVPYIRISYNESRLYPIAAVQFGLTLATVFMQSCSDI